ncbi:MAG: hypothetical protein ACYC3S_11145 [Chloroflexota bacterium]
MRLKLDVDGDTAQALIDSAVAERRPVVNQTEVLLRRALGLPLAPTTTCPGQATDENSEEVDGNAA